jgi:hypothetical protein
LLSMIREPFVKASHDVFYAMLTPIDWLTSILINNSVLHSLLRKPTSVSSAPKLPDFILKVRENPSNFGVVSQA